MVTVSATAEEARSNGDSPGEDLEPVGEPSYAPAWIAAGAAVGAGLLVMAVLTSSLFVALGPAGFGVTAIAIGVFDGRRWVVSFGVFLLFAGLLLAGIEGARPPPLLLAAVGTAVAYDAGHYAVTLGEQLRAGAPTTRAELVHVGATTIVASAVAGAGTLTFRVGTGGQPSTALVALLLATVLLVWALLR